MTGGRHVEGPALRLAPPLTPTLVPTRISALVVRRGGNGTQPRSPAPRDAPDIAQAIGQPPGQKAQFPVARPLTAEQLVRMTDEVIGHTELQTLDVIGHTGDMARAVPEQIAGIAVGAGPGQEAGEVVVVCHTATPSPRARSYATRQAPRPEAGNRRRGSGSTMRTVRRNMASTSMGSRPRAAETVLAYVISQRQKATAKVHRKCTTAARG
ncbi:hypothetical protein Srufu_031730 [Streptomyces libani subsp. rufus]|nr:hypothetical protein Srufu_031730 [Streptomyces libani subsp. rufus]